MATKEQVIQTWQELLESKQTRLKYRNAHVGNGGGIVEVEGEPGFIWCRYSGDQSRVSKVFCAVRGLPEGFPIKVGRAFPEDEFEQVLKIDWAQYQDIVTADTMDNYTASHHGESHNAASGSDPVPVDLRNIIEMRGRALASPDLTIFVQRGQYIFGYNNVKQFPGEGRDLTASVPGVPGHRLVLVYVDGTTNRLDSDDGLIVPLAIAAPIPDLTANTIPICLVDLEYNQTTITEDDIFDWRFLWDLVSWNAPWLIGTNADRIALTVADLAELTHFAETDTNQVWQVWEGAWRIVHPPSLLAAQDGDPATPWVVDNAGDLTGQYDLILDDGDENSPVLHFVDEDDEEVLLWLNYDDAAFTIDLPDSYYMVIRNTAGDEKIIFNDTAVTDWYYEDDGTDDQVGILRRFRNSTDTPAAGFGISDVWWLENDTESTEEAAYLNVEWETATDGSEDSQFRFLLVKGGAALAEFVKFAATSAVFNEDGLDVDFRVEGTTNDDLLKVDAGNDQVGINGILSSIPDEITATDAGVAASIDTVNTEVTTNGDADLDNVTLANGVSGQIKHIYCVVHGNAGDTWKITPANMIGGSQITFSGAGQGCTLVYADNEGWCVVANNGGTIT